jgi:opacity protein-like surface antigen
MRAALVGVVILVSASSAWAQDGAFGIGGRFAMVRGDVDRDTSAQRFTGGQIRARMSPRTAVEVALDVRTDTNDASTERVRQLPLQASLLLFPVRAPFAPYALGGGGWYTTRVETLAGGETLASESSRKFGWHGGFGAELRLGRHAAAHADYRYTFLDFGDEELAPGTSAPAQKESGLSRFLPSYKGSMWTAGLTLYF